MEPRPQQNRPQDRRDATRTTLVIAGGLLLLLWVWQRTAAPPSSPVPAPIPSQEASPGPAGSDASRPPQQPPGPTSRPGDRLLANYGTPGSTIEQDLTGVGRLLETARVLIKGDNPLPLGSNAEMLAALLGRNARHEVLLSSNHPSLNAAGELLDRWGTPLFFHAQSASRIEIRSAGPDRQMGTADDIQRNADGTFSGQTTKPGRSNP